MEGIALVALCSWNNTLHNRMILHMVFHCWYFIYATFLS